jgi:hypothetical protein
MTSESSDLVCLNPLVPNIRYTCQTVWCSKCWTSGDGHSSYRPSLWRCHLNSGILQLSLIILFQHQRVKQLGALGTSKSEMATEVQRPVALNRSPSGKNCYRLTEFAIFKSSDRMCLAGTSVITGAKKKPRNNFITPCNKMVIIRRPLQIINKQLRQFEKVRLDPLHPFCHMNPQKSCYVPKV